MSVAVLNRGNAMLLSAAHVKADKHAENRKTLRTEVGSVHSDVTRLKESQCSTCRSLLCRHHRTPERFLRGMAA